MSRGVLFVILMLAIAGPALADMTGNVAPRKTGGGIGDGATMPRTGGDTIASATPITSLPFADTGATCGYNNDYDETCPYTGSTAPDVVYTFTPGIDIMITVDLCASQYDTKIYIYAGVAGDLVACNDDAGCGYSGYQSRIENVSLTAGETHYIVIDGYGTSCGTYDLNVVEVAPGTVDCPPGAAEENEPDCYDGYYDTYNGGCNSTGWTDLGAQARCRCADMCGKSGTYIYQGNFYRDTDWYTAQGVGENVVYQCTAEFPLQMFLIYGTNCSALQFVSTQVPPYVMGQLSWPVAPWVEVWLWAGPSVFDGLPCGSEYLMHVCGIVSWGGDWGACCLPDGSCMMSSMWPCDNAHGYFYNCTSCDAAPCVPVPVPVKTATWGRIKATYR